MRDGRGGGSRLWNHLVGAILGGVYLAILIATAHNLGYARDEGFYFTAARDGEKRGVWSGIQRFWTTTGRWAITIAFGTIFAGAMLSRLSFLIARVQFLWNQVWSLVP